MIIKRLTWSQSYNVANQSYINGKRKIDFFCNLIVVKELHKIGSLDLHNEMKFTYTTLVKGTYSHGQEIWNADGCTMNTVAFSPFFGHDCGMQYTLRLTEMLQKKWGL